ncbi:MAG: EAL domain-containing protein [Clostridia bacterium]|nr:EAL domain-containing protein [Clostridia bacterium]
MNVTKLKAMITAKAFRLYGQPKWTFGQNTCNTYEVFPETMLADDKWVPIEPALEEIEADDEMSLLFSQWFIKEAIVAGAELAKKADSNVTLSLNLLPTCADEPGFVEELLALLEVLKFPPRKLQFELSEAQILTPKGVENLNYLHDEHGVGLWLANFGTGFSNVDLLREVHFDGLELDRSYAKMIPEHEQTCRLVIAIQHFADMLGLKLCAKGIETQDQFEFFEELDFFKGQGYLIHEPIPMDELVTYIDQHALHRGHA